VYAVGVTASVEANIITGGGGVYLVGQQDGGWGRLGAGCVDQKEGLGQNRGRWFSPLPFGVAPTGEYPSVVTYNGRTYVCGGYSYQIVIDEHHRIWKQGIRAPEAAPAITGAAGATNIAYLSWWDELTGERSPLSKGFAIGDAVPRTWNTLPIAPPDDVFIGNELITADLPYGTGRTKPLAIRYPYGGKIRQLRGGDRYTLTGTTVGMVVYPGCVDDAVAPAPGPTEPVILCDPFGEVSALQTGITVYPVSRPTHLELWLAIAGDLPRLAMRVPAGTTTVVESKGIADLGEAFITQFQRFPRCSMNAIYHDRQIVAGDLENPDTVYLSALYQPERFEGLSFRTRDGKAVTGLLATRDFCLVTTRSGAYMLQGYTDNDYTMNPIDQSIGAVGHHCNILIHGNPYVWSEKGPYMYNGGWHPLSPENRWVPPVGGDKMIATEDPYYNTYIVSQGYRAAKAFNEPFATWKESGAFEGLYDPDLVSPTELPELLKYFAVLDYTLVQPETGGAVQPARLGWDSGQAWIFPNESPPDSLLLDDEVFMKYLRNRYGRGNLYRIIGNRKSEYVAADWLDDPPTSPSFWVSGMLLPEALIELDFGPEEESQIITAFDYLGDGGGYLMEQKQIKRLWYYMRMLDGAVQLYVGPGPGYWGSRMYPTTAPAIVNTVTFVNGEYRDGVVEAPHADVIMPLLPQNLSGRGMWLRLRGTKLFFCGYGVETIWGSEVINTLASP